MSVSERERARAREQEQEGGTREVWGGGDLEDFATRTRLLATRSSQLLTAHHLHLAQSSSPPRPGPSFLPPCGRVAPPPPRSAAPRSRQPKSRPTRSPQEGIASRACERLRTGTFWARDRLRILRRDRAHSAQGRWRAGIAAGRTPPTYPHVAQRSAHQIGSVDAMEETGQGHLERGSVRGAWMRVRGRFGRGVVKGSGTGD